jgi:valyl-tRNA synthetase
MKTIDTFATLFAPFLPFITEEVYHARPWGKDDNSSLHVQSWPLASDFASIQEADSVLYDSVSLIASEIRKAKTIANKTQRTPVVKAEIGAPAKVIETLEKGRVDIENVGSLIATALTFVENSELVVNDVQLDMDFVPEKKK